MRELTLGTLDEAVSLCRHHRNYKVCIVCCDDVRRYSFVRKSVEANSPTVQNITVYDRGEAEILFWNGSRIDVRYAVDVFAEDYYNDILVDGGWMTLVSDSLMLADICGTVDIEETSEELDAFLSGFAVNKNRE